MTGPGPGGVFISYRRDDAPGHAGRLRDHLIRARPGDRVFMDVDSIRPGADFDVAIQQALTQSQVLLAIIGPRWSTVAGPDGSRRLDEPGDYVAREIAAALQSDITVIPVLVAGTAMPPPATLPERLRPLAFREAFELRDTRWDRDVADLTGHLADPAPAVAPEPPVEPPVARRRHRGWWIAAIAVVTTAIAAGAAFLVWPRDDTEQEAVASVSDALPDGARDCTLARIGLAGLTANGAACQLDTANGTARIELHRVTDLAAAESLMDPDARDRPGTCLQAPTGDLRQFGDSGRGGFRCDGTSITWLDRESEVYGRVTAPDGGSASWAALVAGWRQTLPSTPEMTLAASLPPVLDGCRVVPADQVDTSRSTTAEMMCNAAAEMSSLRVGLSSTAAEQDAYVHSWGVTDDVPDDLKTCSASFPNTDPWRANQGEEIRGTTWCFSTHPDGSGAHVRYVWTDEPLRVTYVVDALGGTEKEQHQRAADFWQSLIDDYPPAP